VGLLSAMPHPRGDHAIRTLLPKLLRYFAVSLIGTATTVVLIAVFVGWCDLSPVLGNLCAAGFSLALTFQLDLRWVWRRRGRSSLTRQILPFWGWSLSELGLATLAVHLVADHGQSARWSHETITTAVEVASIGMSMATWLIQYLLFDRLLFVGAPSAEPTDVDLAPPGGTGRRSGRSGALTGTVTADHP
jgi:putative flippase GtrA